VANVGAVCNHCGASVDPSPDEPCPHCGQAAGKRISVVITDKIGITESLEARGVPQGSGRSAYSQRNQQGTELFRNTGRMHKVERVIDRRNNRYYEHIEDAETGEVIRHKDEPLSEHVAERDRRRKKRDESK
jgi:hypothetical protein